METIENVMVGSAMVTVVLTSLFLVWGSLRVAIHYHKKRLVRMGLCPECGQREDAAKTYAGHAKECPNAIPF